MYIKNLCISQYQNYNDLCGKQYQIEKTDLKPITGDY